MTKSGNTWWSGRFLRSLERLGLAPRLQRGRDYLSRGHVLSLVVGTGGVEARVQGRVEYRCRIEFAPFTDLEWEESFERLAFMDLSAAALLTTGRLPPHIEDFFLPTGRRLLPQQSEELEFSCSCPASRGRHEIGGAICKHLAATAYLFAERLDRDPWLLFLVRGRSAEAVKSALTERWNRDTPDRGASGQARQPEARSEVLTADVDLFWEGSRRTDPGWEVPVGKHFPTARRLGTPEPKVEEKVWTDLLLELYCAMSKRAQRRLGSD
jgi:uncharacterized Zn finger protein